MPAKPCRELDCSYPKWRGKQRCVWHWLLSRPIETQEDAALHRLSRAAEPHVARKPSSEWPPGKRWCAGCQSWVPMFYTRGSRCVACRSRDAHRSHVARTYNLAPGEYDALLRLQEGRCALCRRRPVSRRLAVDHDHATGRVRGLLCADDERGCNHVVVGLIEANSQDGPLAMAHRIVDYFEHPPYAVLKTGTAVLHHCQDCGALLDGPGAPCSWCQTLERWRSD